MCNSANILASNSNEVDCCMCDASSESVSMPMWAFDITAAQYVWSGVCGSVDSSACGLSYASDVNQQLDRSVPLTAPSVSLCNASSELEHH